MTSPADTIRLAVAKYGDDQPSIYACVCEYYYRDMGWHYDHALDKAARLLWRHTNDEITNEKQQDS